MTFQFRMLLNTLRCHGKGLERVSQKKLIGFGTALDAKNFKTRKENVNFVELKLKEGQKALETGKTIKHLENIYKTTLQNP